MHLRGLRHIGWLLVKRIPSIVAIAFLLGTATFFLQEAAPGSTERAIVGPTGKLSPARLAAIREKYDLDGNMAQRYLAWLGHAVRGDLGTSIRTQVPVATTIRRELTSTGKLAAFTMLLTLTFGIPLGMLAALRARTWLDRGVVALSTSALSLPQFIAGLLLVYLFGVQFAILPVFGAGDGFWDSILHLVLPAVTAALGIIGYILKITRASMLDSIDQDYVFFARARGVPERVVVFRYALRNALLPVLTASGLVLTGLVGGLVIIEIIFSLPGIGSELVASINYKDVPMVQGAVISIGIVIMLVNFAVEVAYPLIDPRVDVKRGEAV